MAMKLRFAIIVLLFWPLAFGQGMTGISFTGQASFTGQVSFT